MAINYRPLPAHGYLFQTILTKGQIIDMYNYRIRGRFWKRHKGVFDTRSLGLMKLSDRELRELYNSLKVPRKKKVPVKP